MVKSPEATQAFADEVGAAAGTEPRLDRFGAQLASDLRDVENLETRARGLVERMALALQASLLIRFGDPAVADAFCATRIEGNWGHAFGTLPAAVAATAPAIVARHSPATAA
jgi:putative acyl-CoA dehydrogenase